MIEEKDNNEKLLKYEVQIETLNQLLSVQEQVTVEQSALLEERMRLLGESELKFRTVFENSGGAIIIADAQTGMILECNHQAEELLGRSRTEILTLHQSELHPSEKAEEYRRRFDQHREKGHGVDYEGEVQRKNGQRVPVWVSAQITTINNRAVVMGLFVDITEQRKAREALLETQMKWRVVFDQTYQFIGLMTTDGILIEVNRSALQLAGVPESAVLGKLFWDTPWWTHSPSLQAQLRDAVKRAAVGEFIKFEATHPASDGSIHYVDFSLKPMKDKTGRVTFLIPEGRDITQRKHMEQALRQAHEELEFRITERTRELAETNQKLNIEKDRFQKISETVSDYICTVSIDEEGKPGQTIHSPSCIGITGYSDEEFKSQPLLWIGMVPEEDRVLIHQQIGRILSGKQPGAIEHRIVHKDGRVRWVRNTPVLHFNARGVLTAYDNLIRDITERKMAEQKLMDQYDFMKNVLESLGHPFYVINVRDYTIALSNLAARKFGDMTLGMTCHALTHKSSRPCVGDDVCPLEMVKKTKKAVIVEHKHYDSEGHEALYEVRGYPIFDKNNEVVQMIEYSLEITDRKKAEAALILAKRQAEVANQIKSQFLANMSHEIRTPLNAVIGFSELLENTPLNQMQKDYINTVRESGRVLLFLINDILDVSKIEAGELRLEKIDFDLNYLIKSAIKINSAKLEGKPVDLVCEMDEVMPLFYKGDPTRIRQILMNLLSNAIKFTKEGKITVLVGAKKSSDGRPDQEGVIEISVRDTGVGIPKGRQEKIFEAFEQADTSTTREYGGTGLGLTICRALVKAMDGLLMVDSEPGRGSTFTFTLKLEKASSAIETNIVLVAKEVLRGKKVIIVDDNPHVVKMLTIYCQEIEMTVLCAVCSAKEVVDYLLSHSDVPDIILSNILMPGMDGYELAAYIRQNEKTKLIKLVAITGDAKPGVARRAYEAGFDAYLPKPIAREELLKVIQIVMGDKRDQADRQLLTRHMAEEFIFKGLKILVVEDNQVNQKLLQMVLSNLGCQVDLASNGKVAVEKIKSNAYQLVFMDLQMPIMGGLEAVRIIRSQISQTLPIVALTAAAMKEDEENSLRAGMNGYITKPVELSKLKEAIRQWIVS